MDMENHIWTAEADYTYANAAREYTPSHSTIAHLESGVCPVLDSSDMTLQRSVPRADSRGFYVYVVRGLYWQTNGQ
jgi:hypothetical protein